MSFRKTYNFTRHDSSEYIGGVWRPGTAHTLTLRASVQPTNPSDMENLPEGQRGRKTYTLYTSVDLKAVSENESVKADIVHLQDGDYEVISVEAWENRVIQHFKAIVVKIPGTYGSL